MELILNATKSGNSSEVFVPKMGGYSLQYIADVAKEVQVTQDKKSLE